jgi:hypothetical protein
MNWPVKSNFLSHLPIDWIILFVLTVFFASEVVRAGSSKIYGLVLALPTAILLSDVLPKAGIIGSISSQLSSPVLRTVVFGIIFACSYIIVRRVMPYGRSGGGLLQGAISGIAATAIVVVIWIQVPELKSVWSFGGQVQNVFGELYQFWWLAGSYSALAFAKN